MTDEQKINIIIVQPDGTESVQQEPPIAKVKATKFLTPEEIKQKILEKQRAQPQ